MARLLIVEDDEGIRIPLTRALEREGYAVDGVADGEAALLSAAAADHDLIIVDVGLPGIDGLEVCRRVRAEQPSVPILFLTAQDGELDIVDGLDAGADDYVTKPFRVERAARPCSRAPPTRDRRAARARRGRRAHRRRRAPRVVRGARSWSSSPKEFDLLALLVREAGRVVTRERIMAEVWDENWFGSTKTLDMHVSWLRRKLGEDAANPRHLVTVRGVGLRFEP